jgi:capsular polysaccharide export protein
MSDTTRTFLFLQGPHGPFYWQLARALRRAGARCHRIGFNRGDRAFWPDSASYTSFIGPLDIWPTTISALLQRHAATDLVLYGDTRPIHAEAIRAATLRGIFVHIFEEGYLRPWWITYERGGSNGHSQVIDMGIERMARFLAHPAPDPVEPPGHWGALRRHMFYGALYHGLVMSGSDRLEPHRGIPVSREFGLHLKRLAVLPATSLNRLLTTARIRSATAPYHLALLQLDHDASFRHHGPFGSTGDFLDHVVAAFARGAPPHHHLVAKAHPLEDGRVPVRQVLMRCARAHGIAHRVRFLGGGKLAPLLDRARSVVTVNSTAAQQALLRGLPVKAFGRAVYSKPELVSDQPLDAFFAAPLGPDPAAYRVFRQFLLETSQLPGSFYAAAGRRQALRLLPDIMLSRHDRYHPRREASAAQGQQVGAVRG